MNNPKQIKQIITAIFVVAIFVILIIHRNAQIKTREFALSYFNEQHFDRKKSISQNCLKNVNWGGIDICLPSIQGMKEAMNDPWGEYLGTRNNAPENNTIALYIPENANPAELAKKDLLKDYIKIYSFDYLKHEPVLFIDILNLYKETSLDYFDNKQETIQNYLKDELGIYSLMDTKLVGKFTTDDMAVTFIQFSIYSTNSGNKAGFTFNSIAIVQNRLIYYMYFNVYEDEASFDNYRTIHDNNLKNFLSKNQ